MSVQEVFDAAARALVILRKGAGGALVAEPMFPESHPIRPELVARLKASKPELLRLLDYVAEADGLLLESTRRLAAAWPAGCVLAGSEWEAHEAALSSAYWSLSVEALGGALSAREAFALEVFDRYHQEVPRDE